MTFVLVGGILASGSRAAVGGVAAFTIAFFVTTRNWRALRWMVVSAAVFVSLVIMGVVSLGETNAIGRLLGNDPTAQASDQERDAARRETLESIDSEPFTGVGFTLARESHNVYLQVWAGAGVLGVLGFGAIAVAIGRKLRQRDHGGSLRSAMLCGYVGYLGSAAFTTIFWDRYLWVYVAFGVALYAKSSRQDVIRSRPMESSLAGSA